MKYVTNLRDMLKHVRNHRRRLYMLGMDTKGPTLLKKVVFGMHDIEKFVFLPWLWKYYGGKGDKSKGKIIYTRMNRLGEFLLKCVLFFLPYDKDTIKKVRRFEKIVDVIDRHCDPVAMEEFNLTKQRPLVQFIKMDDMPCAITYKKKWFDKFGKEHH